MLRRAVRPPALHRRSIAELAEQGWVLPASLTRVERAPASTPVGTVDSTGSASVDQRGLVSINGVGSGAGAWSLDWWIGADDRWHLPAQEAAVRQRLVAAAPVVETVVRIPSGDAVQRVYGVRGPAFPGGDEYIVIEVENASPVPFALGLVVRPFTAERTAAIDEITMRSITGGRAREQAQAVCLDGVPALLLPRLPAHSAVGSALAGDVVGIVTGGGATTGFHGHSDPGGAATVAFLFPLPHTAVMRVVLPVGRGDAGRGSTGSRSPEGFTFPVNLPDSERVANGWSVQTRRCPQCEVPDTGLTEGVEATQRALLLASGRAAVDPSGEGLERSVDLVCALDREGLHDEAARILATWADRSAGTRMASDEATAVLGAIVEHWRLSRDRALVETLLPELVAAVRIVDRAPRARSAAGDVLMGVAEMLRGLDQSDAAARVEAVAGARGTGAQVDPGQQWRILSDVVRAASSTWTWPGPVGGRPAMFLATMRALLVAESDHGLAVLPAGAGPWYRQSLSLHDAPTRWGRFSFAVRWHGDRPALLWDLEPHPGLRTAVVTAPVLDPSWSATDPRGEELLAPAGAPRELDYRPLELPGPGSLGRAEAVAPRSVLPMTSPLGGNDDAGPPRDDGSPMDPRPPAEAGPSFT